MRPALRFAAAAIVLTLAGGGCATLDQWQRRAIFQHESSARFLATPAPAAAQEFDLALADGERLHAWYLPADAADAPTVLFLHGARRNLNGSVARIERLRDLGLNVLAIDYRGFGRSSPRLPSEASAIADAQAALGELARREPDPGRRFVYGYSLGGAVAIALAAAQDGMAGVVVEASFTSIPDVLRASRWGWVPLLDAFVTQDFDSLQRIGAVNEPLLLIHGTADGVIPHTMSDRLMAAAARAPRDVSRLVKIEGGSHRTAPSAGGALFDQSVREFVQAVRRRAGAAAGA